MHNGCVTQVAYRSWWFLYCAKHGACEVLSSRNFPEVQVANFRIWYFRIPVRLAAFSLSLLLSLYHVARPLCCHFCSCVRRNSHVRARVQKAIRRHVQSISLNSAARACIFSATPRHPAKRVAEVVGSLKMKRIKQ